MEPLANEGSPPPPIPAAVRTPVWPALLVLVGALPCVWIAQLLFAVLAILLFTDERISTDMERLETALAAVVREPLGLAFVLVPTQVLIFLLAYLPASSAARPLLRLGLRRWRIPTATIACLVLATPLCQLAGVLLVTGLGLEQSAQLEQLSEWITAQEGLGLFLMLCSFTLGAGFTEELFFRGYVQPRLAERWPALLAVLVPAIFFAAMHGDPAHAVGVFPLGLWFGFLAYVSGSVLPAMAAHVLNNLLGVGVLLWAKASGSEMEELGLSYVALLGASVLFLALGVLRLRRRDLSRPAA